MPKHEDIILRQTYHHTKFSDKQELVELKREQGITISLAFPTLNEEKTIGKEILVLKTELMERYPLLDEIAIIDSDSTDNTVDEARKFGAKVFKSKDILRKYGNYLGKGENLWKSLFVLSGDIIVWIDADISNIHPKFVYGLLGPLLHDKGISYVKAFYERPLRVGAGLKPSSGGRVTEVLIRPLFSILYPGLAMLIQPLSGEYAGRRSILEQLPFSVGYGVESGHLIDICTNFGIDNIAQVDLDQRIHRNQSVQALGKMSFNILHTIFNKLKKTDQVTFNMPLSDAYIGIMADKEKHEKVITEFEILSRPPMITIPEYVAKFHS
ncbi:MAG: glucosyl-3-phosphoglycerate synthase [Spirochaetales bacterium]|nr:glucosyl-3-phosphoglycerate synthase [Spirochaetales bacterium]